MTRKEFMEAMGTAIVFPLCIGMLGGCDGENPIPAPTNVNFTLDISSGNLATNGGYLVKDGVLVARTSSGSFLAVSAACTHQGTTLRYQSSQNNFYCNNHGATFSSSGAVTKGPAKSSLATYQTELTGTSLRVFS